MEIFIIGLIFFELFELSWQKGRNFRDYIQNLLYYYDKSVILFISFHPSFYFLIFSQMFFNNFSFLASSITIIKALDIIFKLSLLYKIKTNKDLGIYKILIEENRPIHPLLKCFGIVLYPIIFYFAYFS